MIKLDFLAKFQLSIKSSTRLDIFTLKTRITFIILKQVFIKVLIFHYFNSKYQI